MDYQGLARVSVHCAVFRVYRRSGCKKCFEFGSKGNGGWGLRA